MTTVASTTDDLLELDESTLPPELKDPGDASSEKMHKLTKLLRHIGAIVLFAAAISFVLQGWLEWDSLVRYYAFLGFSLVLSLAGVFCGVSLKDDKGARTFMGVSAAIIPAHLTQLGALLYSLFLKQPADVPQMFLYQAPSMFAALATLAVAAVFLVPIAYSGFAAMARAESKRLTLVFLLANAVLLIPTRDPGFIAIIAAMTLGGTFVADWFYFAPRTSLKNWEGRAVRSMMFVPFALLLGRNLFLYGISQLLTSIMFAAIAMIFFSVLPRLTESVPAKKAFEVLSLPFVGLAWILFAHGVCYHPNGVLYSLVASSDSNMFIPIHILPIGIIYVLMASFTTESGATLRKLGAGIAILSSLAQLIVGASIAASFLCVLMGIITLVGAFIMEEKGLFYIGGIGLGAGILYNFRYALDLYSMSPWLTLAVTGVLVIILSSYLERYYGRVLGVVRGLRKQVDDWN